MSNPSWGAEQALHGEAQCVAGVDEAGRGPLAGPVVAAAVVLPAGLEIAGLNDSKRMSHNLRLRCRDFLMGHVGVLYHVASASVWEVDRLNIYQATRLAMVRAVEGLGRKLDLVLVDGRPWREFPFTHRGVVKGDRLCPSIAAASVLAKCARDDMMLALHREDSRYGFDRHKGYATAAHLAALARCGPGPHHRRSFAPVAQAQLPLGCGPA